MFKAILGCFGCKKCSPQEDTDQIRAESDSKINEESDDHARKDNRWKDNSCTDMKKYYSSSSFLLVNGNPGNNFLRNEPFHHGSGCLNPDKSRIELTEELNNSSYIKISGSSGRDIVKQDSCGAVVKEGEQSDDLTTDDDLKGTFVKENTLSVVLAAEETTISDLLTENIVNDDLIKEGPTTCISARENDKTSDPIRQKTTSKDTIRKVSTSSKFMREKSFSASLNIPDISSLDPILEESTPSDQNSEETTLFVGQKNSKYRLQSKRNVTSINAGNSDKVGKYSDKCKTVSSSLTKKLNTTVTLKEDTAVPFGSGFYDNNVDWSEYFSTRREENGCCRTVSHLNEKGTLSIRNEFKNTFKGNHSVGSDAEYHESDITDNTNNNDDNTGDNVKTKRFEYRDECKTVFLNHTQKPNTVVIFTPNTEVIIGSGFYDNNIDWSLKYSLKLSGENNCSRKSLNHATEDNIRTKSCINESEGNFGGVSHVHKNENIKTEEHSGRESEESQMAHEYKNITGEQFESTNKASLLVHYDRKSKESKPLNKNENIETEEHSGRDSEASQLVHEYQNMAEEHFGGINEASRLVHSDRESEESKPVHEYQNFKQLMNRQYTSEHILSTPKAIDTDGYGNMAVCYVKEDESDRNSKESTFISVESQTVAEFKTNMHLMQDDDSLEYTSTTEHIKVIDKVNNKEFSLVQDDLDAHGREANDYNHISNTEAFCDGKHFTICGSYIIGRIPRKASEDI